MTGDTVPWFPGWVWAGAHTGAQHGPNGYAGHLVDTSGRLTLCGAISSSALVRSHWAPCGPERRSDYGTSYASSASTSICYFNVLNVFS